MHTSNTSDSADDNKITFQFQFILVDTSDKYTGNYYLTAGVEYGDQAYVWVGQAAITTAYQVRVRLLSPYRRRSVTLFIYVNENSVHKFQSYDATIVFNPSPPANHIMNLGETHIFTLDAFVTEPSGDFEFGIFQPLGYTV